MTRLLSCKCLQVAGTVAVLALVVFPTQLAAADAFGRSDPNTDQARPASRYPLEAEIAPDQYIQTWLWVFSSIMLLLIGWLCFKPTRVEKLKIRRSPAKKQASAKKK